MPVNPVLPPRRTARRVPARRTLAALTLSVGLLSPMRRAAGQGSGAFDVFATRKELGSDPVLGGLALSGYAGPFGLRLSGALHPASDNSTSSQQSLGCRRGFCTRTQQQGDAGLLGFSVSNWTSDVDLIFAPLRTLPVARALLLGFSPYAFAGIGGEGIRPVGAADTTRATVSFGAGLQHTLLGGAGVMAEARYRRPWNTTSSDLLSGSRRSWEYRAGLSFAFGGRGSSTRPSVPTVVVAAPAPTMASPELDEQAAARRAARILDRAEGFIDAPYRSGGSSAAGGFDAPGFVQTVYASEGVQLPRGVAAMATAGSDVPTRAGALRPGDLLFFSNDGTAPDHVAIYVGHDRIVHATESGGGVRYDVLGEGARGRWFADHLVSARRVLQEGGRVDAAPAPAPAGDRAPRPEEGAP